MSLEVWGDGDEDDHHSYYAEQFIKNGWWDEDTSARVIAAVKALNAEPMYEDGHLANGISVRFLMRLSILSDECGLIGDPAGQLVVAEARKELGLEAKP